MNRTEIEKVIHEFFDADYAKDADRMNALFHEGSEFFVLNKEGALLRKTGKEFANSFHGSAQQEYPRMDEILSIDFTGEDVAVARTKMRIRDTLYTDLLCFMRINGVWGIVAKVSTGVPID